MACDLFLVATITESFTGLFPYYVILAIRPEIYVGYCVSLLKCQNRAGVCGC